MFCSEQPKVQMSPPDPIIIRTSKHLTYVSNLLVISDSDKRILQHYNADAINLTTVDRKVPSSSYS